MNLLRQFFSHRLIWLALLVSMGIGALVARTVWTIREDEWNYAVRTNANLVSTLEHSLTWTLGAVDQSLRDVASRMRRQELDGLPPELRNRVLFDTPLRSAGLTDTYVVGADGSILYDSGQYPPRKANYADRDYFKALMSGTVEGPVVGQPVVGRVTGLWMLPMARPFHDSEGRVAGIVVSAIRMSYFNELFGSLDLGPNSGVNLFLQNGTIISRFPYGDADVGKSLAGTDNLRRFMAEKSGSYVAKAVLDNVERFYTFRHVGPYPLIVNVAQSSDAILSRWRSSALQLALFAAALMVSCIGLAVLFTRELAHRQRMGAELQRTQHDLHTILDSLPSLVSYWDLDLRNRFSNSAYEEWFGIEPAQLKGMHARELLGASQYLPSAPFLQRALQGERQLFERTFIDKAGRIRHAIVSHVPDMDGGQVRGIFVQVTDISERKRMEDQLFDDKELIRLTLQSIGDAVVCTDDAGRVTYLNPVAERLTGWQGFDASHRNIDEVVQLRDDHGEPVVLSPLRDAISGGRAVESMHARLLHRTSGQLFDVEESASPIHDRHGQLKGAVAVLRDVTEAKAMAQRMAHLAQYDALTDLPNRVLLQDRARQAMALAKRERTTLAVIYLDLDGFKNVNDTLGHDVGDLLLVQFAQRLVQCVRASDTVCRQGGDEFVVLLPGLEKAGDAGVVARKILQSVQTPFELAGRSLHVGVSGGIALYPQHGSSFDDLSRHADSAMYAAKRAGRMRFMLYQADDLAPVPVVVGTRDSELQSM